MSTKHHSLKYYLKLPIFPHPQEKTNKLFSYCGNTDQNYVSTSSKVALVTLKGGNYNEAILRKIALTRFILSQA